MRPELAPQIEESSKMSQKNYGEQRWTMRRKFEPDRLSQITQERAYSILVPPYTLVLDVSTKKDPSGIHQQVVGKYVR